MTRIPESHQDLLLEANVAHVSTKNPDGTLQISPVWCSYNKDNNQILINTARGRKKARNLKEGSPIAISITDPESMYRYIAIQGTVDTITEDGAVDHIDELANLYMGKDSYPLPDGEVRLKIVIIPNHVDTGGD